MPALACRFKGTVWVLRLVGDDADAVKLSQQEQSSGQTSWVCKVCFLVGSMWSSHRTFHSWFGNAHRAGRTHFLSLAEGWQSHTRLGERTECSNHAGPSLYSTFVHVSCCSGSDASFWWKTSGWNLDSALCRWNKRFQQHQEASKHFDIEYILIYWGYCIWILLPDY